MRDTPPGSEPPPSNAVEELAAALVDRSKGDPRAAIKALERLGTPEAVDAIAERALTDADLARQEQLAVALRRLGDPRAEVAEQRTRWLKGLLDVEPVYVPSQTDSGGHPEPAPGGFVVDRAASGGPQPIVTSKGTRLAAAPGATPRPGDTVSVSLKAKKWPDSKLEDIELVAWYQATSLVIHGPGVQHTTLVGMVSELVAFSTGEREHKRTIARSVVPASELEPDGRLTASFRLPDDAPPSIGGVITWKVEAHVRRHRRPDQLELAPLAVHPNPIPETVTASVDPSDWLLRARAVGHRPYADRLVAENRPIAISIDLASTVVSPGEVINGSIALSSVVDGDDSVTEVPVEGAQVSLECWRGSALNQTCFRMAAIEEHLSGPLAFSDGEIPTIPFRIAVPTELRLTPSDDHGQLDTEPPPTFFGVRLETGLDDVRWRIVVALVGKHQRDIPMDSPWCAAREVIVSPRAR